MASAAMPRQNAKDKRTPAARWVGKDTLRDLQRPLVAKKLRARAKR